MIRRQVNIPRYKGSTFWTPQQTEDFFGTLTFPSGPNFSKSLKRKKDYPGSSNIWKPSGDG